MLNRTLKKTYLRVPPAPAPPTRAQKCKRYLLGTLLTPLYWLLALRDHTPGLEFHRRCAQLGLRLLFKHRVPLSPGWSFQFMFLPLDSTRYFELDFMWRALANAPSGRYLDVSSPRLFPILMLEHKRGLTAELINPDPQDLKVTTTLIRASGLDRRCGWRNCRIEDAPFTPESFDIITSISVIEHIPRDTEAIQKMWAWLKPGGRLLLSMPCAAEASEQYINHNEYGLLTPDEAGFVFWQRFYDPGLLEERILSVTGQPHQRLIYGEKVAGAFLKNAERKRAEYATTYPFWREPYMMGREYNYFQRIADLPGEGVVALECVKP